MIQAIPYGRVELDDAEVGIFFGDQISQAVDRCFHFGGRERVVDREKSLFVIALRGLHHQCSQAVKGSAKQHNRKGLARDRELHRPIRISFSIFQLEP